MKYQYTTQKQHFKIFTLVFFIFYLLFFISAPLARAEPLKNINALCFTEPECKAAPYEGEPRVSADCKNQDPRWTKAGYTFQCYAKSASVDLQVSIGGYKVTGIDQYIKRLYTYLVEIAGIVAGIMIVWAGVKWLTSAGIPDRISDAKKKIGNAVIGLVLVLSSYIILQTINPALVNFKLPPVTMMRQDILGVPEWCVKREEFKCGGDTAASEGQPGFHGQYDCNDTRYINTGNFPCGQLKEGKCYGQWCGGTGEGCHSLLMDRFTPEVREASVENKLKGISRKCFNPADCNNCNITLHGPARSEEETAAHGLGSDDIVYVDKVALCISTACNCVVVKGLSPEPIKCVALGDPGAPCSSDAACKSNNCNFSGTHWCTQIGGDGEGTRCEDDKDCKSGICNKGYTFDQCSPDGGETERGAPCYRNLECKLPLKCNTIAFMGGFGIGISAGECWEYPGPEGAQCREDDDCQFGDCNVWTMETPQCN